MDDESCICHWERFFLRRAASRPESESEYGYLISVSRVVIAGTAIGLFCLPCLQMIVSERTCVMKKRMILFLTGIAAMSVLFGGSFAAEEASPGQITIGCGYVADNTNPVDSAWDLTSHGISEGIYMQDAQGNLVSRFVSDLERKDDLTWEATLTGTVKFSDGTDCDAQALADCMNYLQANNSMTNGTAGVVTFTAQDEDTLEIVTERATPVMSSLLAEWCSSRMERISSIPARIW